MSFALPETQLGPVLAALRGAEGGQALEVQVVPARTEGGARRGAKAEPGPKGRLVFVDNLVDASTGTIKLKAEFSNAQQQLWPGQYVRVRLSLAAMPHAALAGNEALPQAEQRRGGNADSGSRRGGGGGGGGPGGGGGGRQRGGGGGMGGAGPGGDGMDGRPMAQVPAGPDRGAQREQAQGLLIAQRVAVAFLDRELKGKPEAADWLAGPAQDWMGPLGQLRRP